ncbi:MAG: retroviral-like aspartic protease family protein [Steroidobacteraceae bacterium]
MVSRLPVFAVVSLALLAAPVPILAACKMTGLAQLPVTMRRSQPVIPAKINGTDVKFLVDSGAFYSIISAATAEGLNLPKTMVPGNIVLKGVGGIQQPTMATVRNFGLAGAIVNDMEFLVTRNAIGGDVVGVLGQNVFSFSDVEYDLGNGAIRLLRAEGCTDADKAYWVKAGEKFSSVAIQPIAKFEPHIVGTAYVNGKKIRVMFDTGASSSVLNMRSAERAGIKPNSPGVVEAQPMRGGGTGVMRTWLATVASFKIGDEEIKDTRLRFGEIELADFDMLLGADFFLSHRIYVAYSANKVLFTYRGGPVFDLQAGANPEALAAAGDAVATGDPADAQGFSRRGAIYAARGDLPRAIGDLTRAIALEPNVAEYFYLRARYYADSRQGQQAMADLDQAINLQVDHLDARVMRAGMRLSRSEATGLGREDAISDIDAARSMLAKEADLHFALGNLYANAGIQDKAMAEFDQWLELHRDDGRAADARALTCRARAVLGLDLGKALSECNNAVRDRPGIAFPLEARGLLHVRMRSWEKAITDLDKVIEQQPRNVWALYSRGLAKLGKGSKADGEKDIEAAKAINPRTVSTAVARGFVP